MISTKIGIPKFLFTQPALLLSLGWFLVRPYKKGEISEGGSLNGDIFFVRVFENPYSLHGNVAFGRMEYF